MRTVNVTFTDEEFKAMKELKNKRDLSWREYFNLTTTYFKEAIKSKGIKM